MRSFIHQIATYVLMAFLCFATTNVCAQANEDHELFERVEASHSLIYSGNNISSSQYIEENATEVLAAKQQVVLTTSFHAPPGATFHAYIDTLNPTMQSSNRRVSRVVSASHNASNDNMRNDMEEIDNITYKELSAYPNPSNGNFTLNNIAYAEESVEIVIYDLIGNKVYSTMLDQPGSSHTFSLTSLKTGVYSVAVSGVDGTQILRLIIS